MWVLTYIIIARIANAVQCHSLLPCIEIVLNFSCHYGPTSHYVDMPGLQNFLLSEETLPVLLISKAVNAVLMCVMCEDMHICLICQCSVEICSYQGAL